MPQKDSYIESENERNLDLYNTGMKERSSLNPKEAADAHEHRIALEAGQKAQLMQKIEGDEVKSTAKSYEKPKSHGSKDTKKEYEGVM